MADMHACAHAQLGDVGDVVALVLRVGKFAFFPAWKVDWIAVWCDNLRHIFFDPTFNQPWLDRTHTTKQMQPLAVQHVERFIVYVRTGHEVGSGVDADVDLVLFGAEHSSGKIRLAKSSRNTNKFESGNIDEFDIERAHRKRIGSPIGIELCLCESWRRDLQTWFVDYVVVDCMQGSLLFMYNGWLKKDMPSALMRPADGPAYTIEIKTSDNRTTQIKSGPTSVFINLQGTLGDSGEFRLPLCPVDGQLPISNHRPFLPGATDSFKIKTKCLGRLTSIELRQTRARILPWNVDYVSIYESGSDERLTFHVGRPLRLLKQVNLAFSFLSRP